MADAFKWHVEAQGDMDTGKAHLCIECPYTPEGLCRFSLWDKPAVGIMWNWNGDFAEPTITPSIDCRGGCGRHFTMVKGVPQ